MVRPTTTERTVVTQYRHRCRWRTIETDDREYRSVLRVWRALDCNYESTLPEIVNNTLIHSVGVHLLSSRPMLTARTIGRSTTDTTEYSE